MDEGLFSADTTGTVNAFKGDGFCTDSSCNGKMVASVEPTLVGTMDLTFVATNPNVNNRWEVSCPSLAENIAVAGPAENDPCTESYGVSACVIQTLETNRTILKLVFGREGKVVLTVNCA